MIGLLPITNTHDLYTLVHGWFWLGVLLHSLDLTACTRKEVDDRMMFRVQDIFSHHAVSTYKACPHYIAREPACVESRLKLDCLRPHYMLC